MERILCPKCGRIVDIEDVIDTDWTNDHHFIDYAYGHCYNCNIDISFDLIYKYELKEIKNMKIDKE